MHGLLQARSLPPALPVPCLVLRRACLQLCQPAACCLFTSRSCSPRELQALDSEQTYAASLSRSMSLVLEQFYQNMRAVGVSAITGAAPASAVAARARAGVTCLVLHQPPRQACCGPLPLLAAEWEALALL